MADKKIQPKAAESKATTTEDRAAARVSKKKALKFSHKKTLKKV